LKVVNIVASARLGGKIDLEKAVSTLGKTMYEPEQFPGLIYRMDEPKVVILIFASGNLVCTGLLMMIIPPFFNSLITFITALRASFSDFAPVQTILPELKISVAVFGLLSLNTNPGNRSGRYSTPG